jgi:hypothetical protein
MLKRANLNTQEDCNRIEAKLRAQKYEIQQSLILFHGRVVARLLALRPAQWAIITPANNLCIMLPLAGKTIGCAKDQ